MCCNYSRTSIKSCLEVCADEASALYIPPAVPYIEGIPNHLQFYRKHVAANIPCVIRNSLMNWKAFDTWTNEYLSEKCGDKKISVSVTPNGLADAVCNNKFTLPEERKMKLSEFIAIIENNENNPDNGVYYIQKQNSNLTAEFSELLCDVSADILWGNEIFGKKPDAANFWMGQSKAVTSLHKDHYENLYCVIKGSKTFTLYPPTDRPFLPHKTFPVYQYKYEENTWSSIKYGSSTVPWIDIDPINPDIIKYPLYINAKPIKCTVYPGEVLYLPSLWFHHVQQSDNTIAVNYWYDMDYDIKYNYYQLLDKLSNLNSEG